MFVPEGSLAPNAGERTVEFSCPEATPETPRLVHPGARLGGRGAMRLEGC